MENMGIELGLLILVGFLWGATNPLLKVGSMGVTEIKSSSKVKKILLELRFIATRWQYVVPFLLNQAGSILYVYALQKTDLSMAVPIANSLTFVFTAISSRYVENTKITRNVLFGMIFVIFGCWLRFMGRQEAQVK